MSILIKGMEMPKYTTKAEFGIDADGNSLCMVYHEDDTEPDIYNVVFLPEGHGRLIDADALEESGADIHEDVVCCGYVEDSIWGFSHEMIEKAHTVIPADEDE